MLLWVSCARSVTADEEASRVGNEWREESSYLGVKLDITTMNLVLFLLKSLSCLFWALTVQLRRNVGDIGGFARRFNTDFTCVGTLPDTQITVHFFSAANMPRDNKTPLIQKIAKQAYITFKCLKSSANGDNKLVTDQHNELISLMTAVRAADLKIAPRKTKRSSGAAGLHNPPVTYMHICETEVFSMGVFLLRTGASIPLHDHPGMNGMLKVFERYTSCLLCYGLL